MVPVIGGDLAFTGICRRLDPRLRPCSRVTNHVGLHVMVSRILGIEPSGTDAERRVSARKSAPGATYSEEYGPKRRLKKAPCKSVAAADPPSGEPKAADNASIRHPEVSSGLEILSPSSPASTGRGALRSCVHWDGSCSKWGKRGVI